MAQPKLSKCNHILHHAKCLRKAIKKFSENRRKSFFCRKRNVFSYKNNFFALKEKKQFYFKRKFTFINCLSLQLCLERDTSTSVAWEFCDIFNNTFFQNTSVQLLLVFTQTNKQIQSFLNEQSIKQFNQKESKAHFIKK